MLLLPVPLVDERARREGRLVAQVVDNVSPHLPRSRIWGWIRRSRRGSTGEDGDERGKFLIRDASALYLEKGGGWCWV
ncbi:hypothetical protein AS9A_3833 [Hoyosella subflava DQS3-9A1]|uniref:Uncharacterized protein n=1 Tax=Hoyosella subflava (strain DSM 45089 / JCM 17490 / NBRC 109087 / DQS3-9A1) TaxID=443218 RepID=F6EGN3_HOYSD|nr:hypothetical protein AS9A_3833 [Hoyosella subflava DQS3-9A1]